MDSTSVLPWCASVALTQSLMLATVEAASGQRNGEQVGLRAIAAGPAVCCVHADVEVRGGIVRDDVVCQVDSPSAVYHKSATSGSIQHVAINVEATAAPTVTVATI